MSIFDLIQSLFTTNEVINFEYHDPVHEVDDTIVISKNDLYEQLSNNPNLHEDRFEEILAQGDLSTIKPHLDGLFGNLVAKKYFLSLDSDVESEVPSDNDKIDLVVHPNDEITLTKVTIKDNKILLQEEKIHDDFAVEVKNYNTTSFDCYDNLEQFKTQLENGNHVAEKSYLGVPRDFLELDFDTQRQIIEIAEQSGDGIIILPYSKYDIEETLDQLISKIS